MRILDNPRRGPNPPCPPPSGAREFHRALSGYRPTPLVDVPDLAAQVGVARLLVKDESERLGLPAFKILGASWAVYRTVLDALDGDARGATPTLDELAEQVRDRGIVLTTATDGNHGRAVAHMARRLGLDARIFVPAGTSPARIRTILDEGARCEVVDGSYDDAVEVAARSGGLVVSDTSWPGYERTPTYVVEGYATIFEEIAETGVEPDALVVPIGVGALGAAAAQWYRCRASAVRLVGVEPDGAHCVLASAEAGEPVTVPGPHTSIMVGLNCGRPSMIAWPWVASGFDVFTAIDDEHAVAAVRALASAGIESGETGAAAVAALLAFGPDALGVERDATVVALSTEGATDPALRARILAEG
jgi:diaminopropionate ammonia-lyase